MVGWFTWALPDHENELGSYHDPNAAAAPMAGLLGWIVGGIVGTFVAIVVTRRARALRTAAIAGGIAALAVLPLAFPVVVLSAFGGAPVVVPVLVGFGVVTSVLARALATNGDRRAERDRLGLLPPPPVLPPSPHGDHSP